MAYTEKVSLSGTALSFLLYECVNSVNCQEGFLVGDVTSEITNHISDSQSDNARLDTQIVIRTVLPLPSVSLFYLPTGRIKEDVLSNLLSNTANEIVGWYKYRKNSSVKPTFRDRLISKGLQKYFEKHHGRKNFATCILSSKTSSSASTHTFTYRFGKINCFDIYEYIEDVTANLGERLTGYKKPHRLSPHSIFNKIVKDSNVQSSSTTEAILRIQEAVDVRLLREARLAAKNECTIRELEAEIKQMNAILSDKQCEDLQVSYNKSLEEKFMNREREMAEACVQALATPSRVDILSVPNVLLHSNNLTECDNPPPSSNEAERSSSPILISSSVKQPKLSYAAASKTSTQPSTSKSNNHIEDLISFDVDDNKVNNTKTIVINDDMKHLGESSPEW
ncbi:BRISC complex subunit FAM175B-like [Cydia splendana]|uniref:BRISC complex subunit FAM175B-like n=1 Tax=Cydia splendana TaxID=1100963 RepID=UPI00212CD3B5